ncbi:hypothetical protein [Vibrio crassostreae]|uniref:hypothetical protein n=1 Tax=Vibrio crassostreae TaxID=246167 RepID=UPI001B30495E|nr:hypothetical protein [Vibrio crassostreae]
MIRTIIPAPERICVYDDRTTGETYDLLKSLNNLSLAEGKLVTLDLSKVQYITAAASLLLFATINTCQLMTGNPNAIKCIFPRSDLNSEGHKYIVKTGLGRALHSGSLEKLEDLLQSKIYYQSGLNPIELLIVTLSIFEQSLTPVQSELLISGIGEAMLNVTHHAYKKKGSKTEIDPVKKDIVDSMGERWWQCAWADPESHSWTFIICDIGLGVSQTYKRELPNFGGALSEIEALKEAFSQGNSRFIGSGRGNGSEDMKRPIEVGAKEELLIYSSGYKYVYNSNMTQAVVMPLGRYFHGTLVQWTLFSDKGGS